MSYLMWIYIISIFIHLVSVIITAFFVIPLQVKEIKVKNGLRQLRTQLLILGVLILFLGVVSIVVLSLRFWLTGEVMRLFGSGLLLAHSLGFLGFGIIGYLMYHQQYTEENKHRHEQMDKM